MGNGYVKKIQYLNSASFSTILVIKIHSFLTFLCHDFLSCSNVDKLLYFLGTFAKLRKATISFESVRPHGTTRLPLDGFSLNFISVDFSKICRENSSFIKVGQE